MKFWQAFTARNKAADHGVRWERPPGGADTPAIYQIFYSEATRRALDLGFLPMDNRANRRPDWREYHPMRSFLLHSRLDEDRFYGFFSPKFGRKGAASGAEVHAFVAGHAQADVVLFSPFVDLQGLFLNSFLQGEYFHPGLLAAAEAFLAGIGWRVDLRTLVMDRRTSVFSNYFVAKPRFWRAWLALNEQLFALCEAPGRLQALLTAPTEHDGRPLPMKIFLQERAADLLLATQPQWRAVPYPDSRPSTVPVFSDDPGRVMQGDALKRAYLDSGDEGHLREYHALLQRHGLPPSWAQLAQIELARRSAP